METATLDENVKWVRDFNLNLGVNCLGGVLGVSNAFADSRSLLTEFVALVDCCRKIDDRLGERAGALRKSMVQRHFRRMERRLGRARAAMLCMHFLPFAHEAHRRLLGCKEFKVWAERAQFEFMPDIFTAAVLRILAHRIDMAEAAAAKRACAKINMDL